MALAPIWPVASPHSLRDLLVRLRDQAWALLSDGFRLLIAEMGDRFQQLLPVLILGGLAGLCIALAVLCLGTAAVLALTSTLPAWGAALVVGAGALGSAVVLWSLARRRLQRLDLRPRETLRSLREGVEWLERLT